jgi:hypothetical protein
MYTPTLTQLPKICGQQKRWNLLFVLGGITHALKTWSLCGLHPMAHTFKDLILWGSFTKTTWVSSYTLIQHCISNNVYCHKYPLHQDYSHILTQNSNMGLSKTKFFYLKAPPTTPLIHYKGGMDGLLSPFIHIFINHKPMGSCQLLFSYN